MTARDRKPPAVKLPSRPGRRPAGRWCPVPDGLVAKMHGLVRTRHTHCDGAPGLQEVTIADVAEGHGQANTCAFSLAAGQEVLQDVAGACCRDGLLEDIVELGATEAVDRVTLACRARHSQQWVTEVLQGT